MEGKVITNDVRTQFKYSGKIKESKCMFDSLKDIELEAKKLFSLAEIPQVAYLDDEDEAVTIIEYSDFLEAMKVAKQMNRVPTIFVLSPKRLQPVGRNDDLKDFSLGAPAAVSRSVSSSDIESIEIFPGSDVIQDAIEKELQKAKQQTTEESTKKSKTKKEISSVDMIIAERDDIERQNQRLKIHVEHLTKEIELMRRDAQDMTNLGMHGLGQDSRRMSSVCEFVRGLYGDLIKTSFCITNLTLPDNPITFVSPSFCKMTGYSAEEVIGSNCRFLQGDDTDQRATDYLRQSIEAKVPVSVVLKNYRKDKSQFWNYIHVSPIFGANNKVTQFVGVQTVLEEGMAKEMLKLQEEMLDRVVKKKPKSDEIAVKAGTGEGASMSSEIEQSTSLGLDRRNNSIAEGK
eukprot:g4846.t1